MKAGKTYFRTFGVFLAVYFLLMAVFTLCYGSQVKKQQINDFGENSTQLWSSLSNFFGDWERYGEPRGAQYQNAVSLARQKGISIGVHTDKFSGLFEPNTKWYCQYTPALTYQQYKPAFSYHDLEKDSDGETKVYQRDNEVGYLDFSQWFSKEDCKKIEEYAQFSNPDAELYEISYYAIHAEGMWVSGMEVIPKKIVVEAMGVVKRDERGETSALVTQSIGRHVFSSNANEEDTVDLSYYSSIYWVLKNGDGGRNLPLYEKVNDPRIAKRLAESKLSSWEVENSGLGKLSILSFLPGGAKTPDMEVSGYLMGKEIDLWALSKETIIPVWIASLGIVLLAALFTSVSTVRSERARLALENARRDMTNGIAHDLKTPLAVISGYGEMLAENLHADKREHYAKSIVETTKSMDEMVCQMLEVSKLERPKLQLNKEKLSLGALVNEVILEYEPNLSNIECTVEGDAELLADRALMKRVIENFLSNAVKHRSEGGKIKIDISDRRFSIFNSGAPILEKDLPNLWNAYTKTESQRGGGSGLGLYLAAQILKKHGFTYGAENKDGGAEFWVNF